MEWLGYISALCFFLGYLPQLYRTYRLKSVDDISPLMWWLTSVAYFSGLMYGIYLDKSPLILSYMLGWCCTNMMLVMYYLYRDPRKNAARTIVRRFLNDIKKKNKEEGW